MTPIVPRPALLLVPAANELPLPASAERARKREHRERRFRGPAWGAPDRDDHVA